MQGASEHGRRRARKHFAARHHRVVNRFELRARVLDLASRERRVRCRPAALGNGVPQSSEPLDSGSGESVDADKTAMRGRQRVEQRRRQPVRIDAVPRAPRETPPQYSFKNCVNTFAYLVSVIARLCGFSEDDRKADA
jgi:hypothetical protein